MSEAAVSLGAEPAIWRPAANPWLIAVTVSMAAFMEVLDTAIANVALPHIAGNLGGEQRSEHMGPHFLSGCKCHRAAHHRLARKFLRT